jgi:predicted PurR-regulated permease PerM
MQVHRSDRVLAIIGLSVLAGGCLLVVWPFLTAIAWAAILASTSWTVFLRLEQQCKQRRILAASLMTLLVTVVLLVPVLLATMALADNVAELGRAAATLFQEGLPEPPGWMANIPLIGGTLLRYWQPFIHDGQRLTDAIFKLAAPLQNAALAGGGMLGRGVLDIALSIFLSFFFFIHGEAMAQRLSVALHRIAGERAERLVHLARHTVSGVTYGVLGTALAQGILAAIGFLIAGVPGAALLGVATFFFSVVPFGPPLIWGGAAIWLFQQGDMAWMVFTVVWGALVVSTVDNIIKPLIISRGSRLPFAVVFLGVLGGVLAFGVIGAFLGPALLAVGFGLLNEWLADSTPRS